jgi:hypothetical protein
MTTARVCHKGVGVTFMKTVLGLLAWPLAIMVIGMIIVRIQNGVWWNEVVTTMVVSGLVVSCAMAVYAARKDRAVRRQAAASEPERS